MDYFEEDSNRIVYKYKDTLYYKVKIDELDMTSGRFLNEFINTYNPDESILKVVLDMNDVKYIDSTITGILIHINKSFADRNKIIEVYNLSNSLKHMFEVVGLYEFFNIKDEYLSFPIYSIEVRK